MKNNKVPRAFYIAFGWVLGCYTSMVSYLNYKEYGLWGLCILSTGGLLLSVLYYHNKLVEPEIEPEKQKKSLKDRIFNGGK